MNGKTFLKTVKQQTVKRSPEILTGMGIAGMITTIVLAVKATPKALRIIEKEESEDYSEPLKKTEIVKIAWKPYVPAGIMGCFSIFCLIGASSVNLKRNAAIAAAYKLSESALVEYKEKVIETIGEKKEKTIREKVDKDRIDNNPVSKSPVIVTEKGNTLCFDVFSGQYFRSDIEAIKRSVNELNKQMLTDMYVSLNDFYNVIGLKPTKIGSKLGWNINDNDLIEIDFTSQIADDGTPCLVLNYESEPVYNYAKLY